MNEAVVRRKEVTSWARRRPVLCGFSDGHEEGARGVLESSLHCRLAEAKGS